jgi:hypothetical protein
MIVVPSLSDELSRIVFDAAPRRVPAFDSETDGLRPNVEDHRPGCLIPSGRACTDFCAPSWCRRRPRPSISLVLFWFALAGSCVFRRRTQGQTPFPSMNLTPAASNRAKSLAMVIDVHTLRVFDRRRFLSRTPGWSAFVNSTPAASRACLITLSVDRRCSPLPASNKRMVATPTPAASASCC